MLKPKDGGVESKVRDISLGVNLPQKVRARINVLADGEPNKITMLYQKVKDILDRLKKPQIREQIEELRKGKNIKDMTEATKELVNLDKEIAVHFFRQLLQNRKSPYWDAREIIAVRYIKIARKTPDVYGHQVVEDVGRFLLKEKNPHKLKVVAFALSKLCYNIENPLLKHELNNKIKNYLKELVWRKDPIVRSSAWQGLKNVERLINSKT